MPSPSGTPATTPSDPASVVENYYSAINAHDYRRAWDLGGSHLAQSYASFAAGFSTTAADALSIDSVQGATVTIHLHAVHTDATTADYAGSYTVEGGTIAHASVQLVATGGGSPVPAPSTPGASFGAVNPAVTQSTVRSTICVVGWTASIRPPAGTTELIKKQQLAASRVADKNPSHYEEDHIIPLELGGAPADPANLRPVPLARARNDDRLENALHEAVCAGTMTLAAAQAQMEQAKAAERQP
jgi:hypothetical protein